jgi:hypothetical protein
MGRVMTVIGTPMLLAPVAGPVIEASITWSAQTAKLRRIPPSPT